MIKGVIIDANDVRMTLLQEHNNCPCYTLRLKCLDDDSETVMEFKDIESVRQHVAIIQTLIKDQPELQQPNKSTNTLVRPSLGSGLVR